MNKYVCTIEETDGESSIQVVFNNTPIPLRLDIVNHSPTGFEFGYYGSGPAQLALAILAHHTQNDQLAEKLHQKFKRDIIANLERKNGCRFQWELKKEVIEQWIENNK